MRRHLAVLAALATLVAAPTAADAATRYASPAGSGPEPCAEAAPCSLATATGAGLRAGDTVLLLGDSPTATISTYSLGRTGIVIGRQNVTLAGRGPGAIQIISTSNTATVQALLGGATIRGLRIFNACGVAPLDPQAAACTGSYRYALNAAGANVQQVIAWSLARRGCGFLSTMTVANTVCVGTSSALEITGPGVVTLTNVTARASATYPAVEIVNPQGTGGACGAGRITIVNTIVSAAGTFLPPLWANRAGQTDTAGTCPVEITLRNSSVPRANTAMNVAITETDPILGAPTYADAQNVIPAADSPTVDRGSTRPADLALAGPFDVIGAERVQGGRVDIGAYESSGGAPAPDPLPPDLGQAGAGGADGQGGGAPATATISASRPRATVRARAIAIGGRVAATGAGTATRTVTRIEGRRRVQVCRVRLDFAAADTRPMRCTSTRAVRNLLRRRGIDLVVTTRFVPAGARTAVIDRQTLKVRRR